MGILKPSKVVKEEWGWDPNESKWTDDRSVRCTNNQFGAKDKSMCYATIERGQQHGWTIAASDYYYYVLEGSCTIQVDGESKHPITFPQGESFCVEKGTRYNYWADDDKDLRFVLFMSKLWEEE